MGPETRTEEQERGRSWRKDAAEHGGGRREGTESRTNNNMKMNVCVDVNGSGSFAIFGLSWANRLGFYEGWTVCPLLTHAPNSSCFLSRRYSKQTRAPWTAPRHPHRQRRLPTHTTHPV